MQLGMIGLGRMGANIVRRLMRDGHDCVVLRRQRRLGRALETRGRHRRGRRWRTSSPSSSKPRVGLGDDPGRHHRARSSTQFAALLEAGDIIIDGGNSNYRDDVRRAAKLQRAGHPLRRHRHERRRLRSRARLLPDGRRRRRGHRDHRPDPEDDRARAGEIDGRPGRSGDPAPEEQGYLHCGPSGAGHFVKMVHNGIEYGIMAAFAEG